MTFGELGLSIASMERLSPVHFQDYREFLKAYYHAKKNGRSAWSYRVWARTLELSSPSTLLMILQGSRDPSDRLMERMFIQLQLNDQEKLHFRHLVEHSRASQRKSSQAMAPIPEQTSQTSQQTPKQTPKQTIVLRGHISDSEPTQGEPPQEDTSIAGPIEQK